MVINHVSVRPGVILQEPPIFWANTPPCRFLRPELRLLPEAVSSVGEACRMEVGSTKQPWYGDQPAEVTQKGVEKWGNPDPKMAIYNELPTMVELGIVFWEIFK